MITKTCFVAAALALAACRGERQASAAATDPASPGPPVGGVGRAAPVLATAEGAQARAVGLVRGGFLPQKDGDRAAASRAQAKVAEITARRAKQLAALGAPRGGVVTRMSAVLGASVDVSQSLVEV